MASKSRILYWLFFLLDNRSHHLQEEFFEDVKK